MGKVILVLLDGCGYEVASELLGCVEGLLDSRPGAKYRVQASIPSLSRPAYQTILTGLPPHEHGVWSNQDHRISVPDNVFTLCRTNGLNTAAAAYHWGSELYSRTPFDPHSDRIQLGSTGAIANGLFYFEDGYPDTHVYADGEFLRRTFQPDFLLLHSMNIDDAGHGHGSASAQYRRAVLAVDSILADLLPTWLHDGHSVVITADHGMDEMGMHGGTTQAHREVPLYVFADEVRPGRHTDASISQLSIAPLLCRLLGLPPSAKMQSSSEIQ